MSEIQNNYQKYHSHISSKHKWFDLKFEVKRGLELQRFDLAVHKEIFRCFL